MTLNFSLAVLCLLFSCGAPTHETYRFEQPAMGTRFRIAVSTADTAGLATTIRRAFLLVDSLEAIMSDYRPDSELNRLARRTGGTPVSTDLYRVLDAATTIARETDGAFDPTIGPLTRLWRRAFRSGTVPDSSAIAAARGRVGWQQLRMLPDVRIDLERTGMQLDLGGIAKGYTLDRVGELLRQAGYDSYLLDGGGDLLLGAAPDGKDGWSIAGSDGEPLGDWYDVAVATSGAQFRFLEAEGVRYSHIIDPRTGYGLTDPRPITIIGPAAAYADALASAYSVLGSEAELPGFGEYRIIR